MNKNKEFNAEKILNDLCLSSPSSDSMMFYIRNKMNKEAEKILIEEGLLKKDIDKNDVWKLDDFDASDVTTYLVKYGNLLEKSKLHEVEKGKFVFYLNNQPPLLLEKVEQLWKIVRKIKT